ncbi:MAG: biotin-dependent carboxyltransferase family protein [Bacteroidia bacterium]|nr:biotin-dependent carboxyltransferase family protein [Bacteroidia bacterium]NNF82251.1 biotin-dependent carboxyltransferase family protein [Flavobacteriaceae bacterium]
MIEVLKPGILTSIQDKGRFDGLEFGIPVSGAMDQTSMQQANMILDNKAGDAVLEMALFGPKLRFASPTLISIAGADMSPTVNGEPLDMLHPYPITSGDVLEFKSAAAGCRSYLAVKGGLTSEVILGSRSQYDGITEASCLSKGAIIPYQSLDYLSFPSGSRLKMDRENFTREVLEVFPGPEFNGLSDDQKDKLFRTSFTISHYNNRMAYQLNEELENSLSPIITAPVMPGTVQLTPSGKLIILMRDAQTTGGYPRILQLDERAIDRLSQKYEGQFIRFKLY